MRARADEEEEVDVQMTPLIDCVFLLLVFFLMTATLKKPHKELALELPHSAAAKLVASEFNTLIIELTKDGDVYVESEPMTSKQLDEFLHRVVREDPRRRVRIDADRTAPVQYLIRLTDHLQFVGLNNVGLRARE